MSATRPQLAIAGLKTQQEAEAERKEADERRDRRAELRLKLMNAIKRHTRNLTSAVCAGQLDADAAVFRGDKDGGDGSGNKGVSESLLNATLDSRERNYFRLDWLFWFIDESEDVRAALIEAIGLPEKDPKEELHDLQNIVRAHYPKAAETHIRDAKKPRVRR